MARTHDSNTITSRHGRFHRLLLIAAVVAILVGSILLAPLREASTAEDLPPAARQTSEREIAFDVRLAKFRRPGFSTGSKVVFEAVNAPESSDTAAVEAFAQDAATENFLRGLSGTRREVAEIVIESVQQTGHKVVGIGSWLKKGSKYLDPLGPLSGGALPSDEDLRLVFEGLSDDAARDAWIEMRNAIQERVIERFNPKDAQKVLASINLYPPDQLLKGATTPEEALQILSDLKINPSLSGGPFDGWLGKGTEAARQAYEATSGRVFFRDANGIVRSGFADIVEGETAAARSIFGEGNLSAQMSELSREFLQKTDAKKLLKNLERLSEHLAKGRSMGGAGKASYLENVIKKLKASGGTYEEISAALTNDSALFAEVEGAITKARLDAEALKILGRNGSALDAKFALELLEGGTKWGRFKALISALAGHITIEAAVEFARQMVVWHAAEKAIESYYKDDKESASQYSIAAVSGMANLPAALLMLSIKALLDDAKELGYGLAIKQQDCQELIAGIYEVKGREEVSEDQRIERSIDQLALQYTTKDLVEGVVALHARNAATRNGVVDPTTEQKVYAKCAPEIVGRWALRREQLIADAAEILLSVDKALGPAMLIATANPDPVILAGAAPSKGDANVNVVLDADIAAITQALNRFEATIKPLGGAKKEVQISVQARYSWLLDGREIAKEEKLYVGVGQVFQSDLARKTISLTTTGQHTIQFHYSLAIETNSIVDDVLAAKRFLTKTIDKKTTATINAIDGNWSAKINGPDTGKVDESLTLSVDLSPATRQLKNVTLRWTNETARVGLPSRESVSFTPREATPQQFKLEVFADVGGQELLVASAAKTVTIEGKEKNTPPTPSPTPTPTPKPGEISLIAPKEILATDLIDVQAIIPADLQSKTKGSYWNPNNCSTNSDIASAKVQFRNPTDGKPQQDRISFNAQDADKKTFSSASIDVIVKPALFKGSASDVWEGGSSGSGLVLQRKPAVRKRENTNSAIVNSGIEVKWAKFSAPQTPEAIQTELTRRKGTDQDMTISAITIAGFKGFVLETRGVKQGFTAAFVDEGRISASASGSGFAIKGCLAIEFSYNAGGGGLMLGEGTGFGKPEQAWWNDTPFLLSQTRAAVTEAKSILTGLTLTPDGKIGFTPYKGPKLDGSDMASVKLVVSPDIKKLKKGDVVNVQAVIENEENAEKPLEFSWTGDHAGSGSNVQFLANKPGKQSLSVTVKGVGAASVEFEVADFKAEIVQVSPTTKKVAVGTPVTFSARLLSSGAPITGNYVYRWQPTPEVTFQPIEADTNTTKAVFSRPGVTKVWVQILEKKGTMPTPPVDSDQIEIEVVNPELAIKFDPAKVFIGKEVKARVEVTPADLKDIDFRWEISGNARQTMESQDKREVTLIPQNAEPITVTVRALLPFTGDDLGEKTASITPQKFEVKVAVLGPMGPKPQVWKEGVGLVTVENAIAVHQNVAMRADVSPQVESTQLRYEWSVNEDSHIVGGSTSNEARFNRSQTGTCEATVIVRNQNGLELGRGSGTFSATISEEMMSGGGKKKEAADKLTKAKEIVRKGQLDEAIAMVADAATVDPTNTEAGSLTKQWEQERETCLAQIEKTKQLMNEGKFPEASNALLVAKNLHGLYKPVLDMDSQFAIEWRKWDSTIQNDIYQIRDANQQKEFKRALDLAAKRRAEGKIGPYEQSLAEQEQWARRWETEKEQKRQLLRAGEEKVKQYDYAGALKDFEQGFANSNNLWAMSDLEPNYFGKLLDEAFTRNKRITELMGYIPDVARDPNARPDLIETAIKNADEVLALQPTNADARRYRDMLAARLRDRTNRSSATTFIKQGDDFYEKSNYQQAIDAFNKALAANPGSAAALAGRCLAKLGLKDNAGALADCSRALQLDPNNADAYRGSSIIKRASNDFQGAVADATRSIEIAPDNYRSYLTRGLAKEGLKGLNGALADYNRAIELNPTNAMSYFYRGHARYDSKDYAGALADYDRYIKMNANDSAAFNNRGLAKEMLGDLNGAIADCESAISLNPNFEVAKNNLARQRAKLAATKTETPPANQPTDRPPVKPPTGSGSLNLALNRPAKQSSTSQWSHPNDAQGAVDGNVSGGYGFHTESEPNPWWQVDLGAVKALAEIRIFNRRDFNPERARTLQVLLSNDGVSWKRAFSNPGTVFGADGTPLRVSVKGLSARFVRLQLAETNYLHLNEVEVYGAETPGAGATPTDAVRTEPPPPPSQPSSQPPVKLPAGAEVEPFNSMNTGGVGNQPTAPATFTLRQPHVINSIMTYHWNDGRGTRAGTIALRDANGRTYGPWSVTGTPGQGGVPNVNWTCAPNIGVPAGTYTIIDSEPATWSQNSQSGGRGMAVVKGYPSRSASTPSPQVVSPEPSLFKSIGTTLIPTGITLM